MCDWPVAIAVYSEVVVCDWPAAITVYSDSAE